MRPRFVLLLALCFGAGVVGAAAQVPAEPVQGKPLPWPSASVPPPPGLERVEPTVEAILAARGNLARWRDAERARLGPSLKENAAANFQARAQYEAELRTLPIKKREKVPKPVLLPEGPELPVVAGYFAYQPGPGDEIRIATGTWDDARSDAGEASTVSLSTVGDCDRLQLDIQSVAWLDTLDAREAFNTLAQRLRPAAATPWVLSGYDVLWLTPPTGQLLVDTFPARALERARSGRAKLRCAIVEGPLACQVVEENPKGWGFGEAALQAASLTAVAPQLPDGSSAIGRELCLSIRYAAQG